MRELLNDHIAGVFFQPDTTAKQFSISLHCESMKYN
jgi:hypothetical protein